MRKIILNLAITFDGMIEGPNGELDWIVKDKDVDYGDILNDILADKDVIFYGRVAFEKFGNAEAPEDASQKIRDAFKLLNSKSKYVFSTNLHSGVQGAEVIHSDIEKKVMEIKKQPGKNIWLYGGAGIATTFFNLSLIDEIRLAVHPVILGSGKPLFQDIETRKRLLLLESKAFDSGATLVKYQVIKD